MKYSELERKIKPFGCRWYEDGSKHPIWISPITGNKFAMSYHKSEEVKSGTLKSILKLAGVKL
ncbi:MAG: type II toxin-antitoxin system HicA family toxin [Tannerella sp.]|jgi:predicted RNA binding protein YcfA (HicA-like mRNA interferase family)|nr:type II toxin-antitoxin system HicA family toxin [Tannerella sp.]